MILKGLIVINAGHAQLFFGARPTTMEDNEDEKLARVVAPKTPPQRLESLVRFTKEWMERNLSELPSKESWIRKFDKNAGRMLKAFNRRTCGFFDPTIAHGGPNPNPKRRNRRDAQEIEDLQRMFLQSESPFQGRYDRENPATGIQQITTGFRKWTERYISECHGQRMFEYQVKRMERWRNILRDHYKKEFEDKA